MYADLSKVVCSSCLFTCQPMVDLGLDGVILVLVVDFSLFTCHLMVLSG